MLIRLLIFSTLVLAVNIVAGIFAKDLNQETDLHRENGFYSKGGNQRSESLPRGSSRYIDSFGMQKDSTNSFNKPKITKRFAKDEKAESQKNSSTLLAPRRRSISRDELRRAHTTKSIVGIRRRYQRLRFEDKENLQTQETRYEPSLTNVTMSEINSSSEESVTLENVSKDKEDSDEGNKVVRVGKNDKIFERRDTRENETEVKSDTSEIKTSENESSSQTTFTTTKLNTTTAAAQLPENQSASSSSRKRRPSSVIRPEPSASPLPVASALTMSESLYNHFRPLDKDVPEDHLLPFLDFGKKLAPVSAKTTSSVSSSSTSSTNSIDGVSTSPRPPALRQYNLLNSTPQKVPTSSIRTTHNLREDEIHEDMDVSVVKSVIEKNKVSRGRGTSLHFLRTLGGLYRKPEASTQLPSANPLSLTEAENTSTLSSYNNESKSENSTEERLETKENIRKKFSSIARRIISPTSTTEKLPSSQVTDTNEMATSSHANQTDIHSNETVHNENGTNSNISNPKEHDLTTNEPSLPTQLSASSSVIEATVSTPLPRRRYQSSLRNVTSFTLLNRRPQSFYLNYRRNNSIPTTFKPPRNLTQKTETSSEEETADSVDKSKRLRNTALRNNTNVRPTPTSILQINQNQNLENNASMETDKKLNSRDVNVGDERHKTKERDLQKNSNESSTKTNLTINNGTSNTSVNNDSSQASFENVTSHLIVSTSSESSHINISFPTEIPSLTSSVQSPTTKILSTAVVTSVSVKGAWPEGVSDNPPLDPTLISLENETTHREYEHTLESPRLPANTTKPVNQSEVLPDSDVSPKPFENASVSTINSFIGVRDEISFESNANESKNEVDFSSRSNSVSTPVTLTNIYTSESSIMNKESSSSPLSTPESSTSNSKLKSFPEVTTKVSPAIRNSSRTPRTDTSPSNNPRTSTLRPMLSTDSNSNSPSNLTTTDHPATIRAKDLTLSSSTEYIAPTVTISAVKPSSSDPEFDFPLLKLYNTSTVWSLPSRGGSVATSSYGPVRISTQVTTKGNTTVVVKSNEDTEVNITDSSIRKISGDDEAAKINTTTNKSESDMTTDAPHNSSSGTPLLGLGNVLYKNTTNVTSQGPRESSANVVVSAQGASIAVYVLSALGIVPLSIGVALAAKYFVQRRRKLLDDIDAYSDISSRRGGRSGGGHSGSDVGSPVSGTKLPRVQTHLTWDQEKTVSALLPVADTRWEFPRSKLRLQTVLGQGNFGQVLKAEADDISGHEGTTRLVAVKTVKEGASNREKEDLLRELEIMQQLGSHANVVTLLGCCTEKEPYLLIMEYVMYGKLLAFLRDHRTRQHYYNFSEDSDALTSRDLTIFAYCVARGMEYLSTKGIIHRDLAARNVLVDHNKMCKIADFGMSRSVRDTGDMYEQRHTKGALPIRWMAPESLHYRIFTHKSDVWSFGILMWEIVTLGSTPYPTMGAREVMRRVKDGYRLERPSHCRIELFRVISRCWHADPNKRPDFASLRHEIGALIENSQDGGGYVDLERFAESKYNYNRSEQNEHQHQHHHHHHHHHPGSAPAALSSRIACDEEVVENM